MGWFDEGGSGSGVDVDALLDTKAWDMLREMLSSGAMVSLGLTSDGGALAVTVTVDGAWRREYFREAEALALYVEEAMAPVLAACEARRASAVPRGRTRGLRGR